MPQASRPLTPEESPLHFFGAELRYWRQSRGLSQDKLGSRIYASGDTISKIEKALRYPTQALAEDCDSALATGGVLIRLWSLVDHYRRTHADNEPRDADGVLLDIQSALAAGRMNLRVDEEGNMWAEFNRRTFLVGTAGAVLATSSGSSQATQVQAGQSVEDPYRFSEFMSRTWPDLGLARSFPSYGADWDAFVPGGRSMLGARTAVQVHPAHVARGRAVMNIEQPQRLRELVSRPERGMLVGAVQDGDQPRYFALDSRTLRGRSSDREKIEIAVPTAYELDDVTLGILWAVSNYDDALQADDQILHETRTDLEAYERLSASAVSREAAPGLNRVAHMWLGSDFCARHILRALPDLPSLPAFWTREQRGEEASAWLLFDHKYPYLQATTQTLGSSTTRAFCVPEQVVHESPRHERILMFLAVALMESLGIHAQFTSDPAYEQVEGFVVSPNREAIIANWVRGDGMWHVDVTGRSSIVREFTTVANDVADQSTLEAPTPQTRLRALATYLDLPWAWLVTRCAALARHGAAGLIQPRSHLISVAGLDAACAYVGSLPTGS